MLVARIQDQGITIEDMRNFRSHDYSHGLTFRQFDGVCAANCATYLLYLIARTCFNENGNPRSCFRTKKSLGELVLMDALDTGQRCMDNQPIVRPLKILKRVPVAEFIDWKVFAQKGKDEFGDFLSKVEPGPAFAEIRDSLEAEHHQETPFLAQLKFYGYISLDEEELKARKELDRNQFKEFLMNRYGSEWFRG